jgi:acyl carrier protein
MEDQLQTILAEIIARSRPTDKEAIAPDADFSMLGVNSIDLLEFVLRVEEAFDVSILDEIAPEDLPTCLSGWAVLVDRLRRVSG